MHACMQIRFSCVWFFAVLQTIALQAPLFMGFSRQEYWSGLPCPSPEDLPNWGIEPVSLTSPGLASRFFATSTTWEASFSMCVLWKVRKSQLLLCVVTQILGGPPGEVLHRGWNSSDGYCSLFFGGELFFFPCLVIVTTSYCFFFFFVFHLLPCFTQDY